MYSLSFYELQIYIYKCEYLRFSYSKDFAPWGACRLQFELPVEMRQQMERYYFAEDRTRYLYSKLLLRFSLFNVSGDPNLINTVRTSKYGKPYVGRNIQFNLSHSGAYETFRTEILDGKVDVIKSDSIIALSQFPDKYFDWIYLDSSHSYEHTKRELEIAQHKIKPDGLICGHDYTLGNWMIWIRFGVIEAVNEFCSEHNFEFANFTMEPSMFFSYGLRKIKPGISATN